MTVKTGEIIPATNMKVVKSTKQDAVQPTTVIVSTRPSTGQMYPRTK